MTPRFSAITPATAVNIGMVATLILAAFSGAWWASQMQAQMGRLSTEHRHGIQLMELKIDELRATLQGSVGDRWTRTDQDEYAEAARVWVEVFALRNPELDIPEFSPESEAIGRSR